MVSPVYNGKEEKKEKRRATRRCTTNTREGNLLSFQVQRTLSHLRSAIIEASPPRPCIFVYMSDHDHNSNCSIVHEKRTRDSTQM